MKTLLEELYKLCMCNESALKSARKCGCFYCLEIFSPDEINLWLSYKGVKTALCPYCTIDSVIPESTDGEYELTKDLLAEMNKQYF